MASVSSEQLSRDVQRLLARKPVPQVDLNPLAELLSQKLGLAGCTIYRQESNDRLLAVSWYGLGFGFQSIDIDYETSVIGRAIREGNSSLFYGLAERENTVWENKLGTEDSQITSVATVLIRQDSGRLGVLSAYGTEEEGIDDEDFRSLEVIAPLIADYEGYTQVGDPVLTGEAIREKIRERGLTQRRIADEIGMSYPALSRSLSGQRRFPDKKLKALVEILHANNNQPKVDQEDVQALASGERASNLEAISREVPEQSPLVRFGVSENLKLKLVPTLSDENDYDTIEALRSELLAAEGPIDHLNERYASNPNVPQANLFAPLISKYNSELSKDLREINYAVLYARGARFYAARRRAAEQVASGEWPELDAKESEAIDAICDLQGPLIMASAVGRKVVEDAYQYEAPPDVYAKDRKIIEEFSEIITTEPGLMEPEDAEAFQEIATQLESDLQPARSRRLGIAATGSALAVIVGGAAWYSAGGAVATYLVPAAALGTAGLLGGFFWESIKTMPRFKQATSRVGEQFEMVLDQAEKLADPNEKFLLEKMASLVDKKRALFEKVANLRPEFGWAKKYITNENQNEGTSKGHVILVGPRGVGKSTVGAALARRMNVPFLQTESELAQAANMGISEIVERDGLPFLNEKELQVFRRLLRSDQPSVIELSTRGTEIDEVWQVFGDSDVAVWLDGDLDLLWSRVKHEDTRHELRTSNPHQTLADMTARARPAFERASIHILVGPTKDADQLAMEIERQLQSKAGYGAR